MSASTIVIRMLKEVGSLGRLKMVSNAFTRKGTALRKMEEVSRAYEHVTGTDQKALAEHRKPAL